MKPASDILELSTGGMTVSSAAAYRHPRARTRLNDFYELTKPRMNFLVVVTTMVGYYMAAPAWSDWRLLLHTLLGTALTAAGASVLNQYFEANFDARMPRTADRPIPAGRISPAEGCCFGIGLALCGIADLLVFVNLLTALLGAVTLLTYIFLYTPLKRWTTLCTVVGAVPGAIPPMMGWTAVSGALSPQALALFGILFFWQMPHFLAIAILYRDDYAAGGFKMLPVVDDGLSSTSRQIVLWSLALIPITLLPVFVNMAGSIYFAAAVMLGLAFLSFGVSCATSKTRIDARKLFFASIIYLPLLLAVMMADKVVVRAF